MTNYIQNVVDALSLGGLYALIALGIALIFGLMRLVNFAHGELIMVGGYAMVLLSGLGLPLMIGGALVVAAVVAVTMERFAFRPIRTASPPTLMVTSFAVSYTLQNLAIVALGAHARTVAISGPLSGSFDVRDLRLSRLPLVTIAVVLILLGVMRLFLTKTALGLHMRAAAEDFEMARLVGVSADKVVASAFLLSGLLAGVVSVLLIAQSGTVSPTVGVTPLIVGVVAVVIGGIGNLTGAVVGGFVLGTLTVLLQIFLPLDLRVYRDAIVFTAVILILLARPQGILPSAQGVRA